jgi:2-keto-4-pentenoate hydratase
MDESMNRHGVKIAAARLLEARSSGNRIDALPPAARPCALESAYLIQDAVAESLPGACGWKVGLTSKPAQDAFLADSPISGRLFADHLLSSPCTIPAKRYAMRGIEAEIVCVLGAAPRNDGPLSLDEIADIVDHVVPAIEICDSRFLDPDWAGLPGIVADNANAGALALGERCSVTSQAFERVEVTLSVTARPDLRGNSDTVLGHPYRAVQWLHGHLLGRGIRLRGGDLIATGSMTGFGIADADARISANFGPLGDVSIEFTSRSHKS